MKAIILAAGKAPRLLPLTKDTPQCLLKVGRKTILEHQIGALNKAGIKDIVVVTGHLSKNVEEFCEINKIKTLFNPFFSVSGTALTLWLGKEELNGGFIFLYSDILFDSEIIVGLMKNKDDICLAIKKDGLREEAEKVIEKGGVIENVSKLKVSGENSEFIGIAKFSKNGASKLVGVLDEIARINLNTTFIEVIDQMISEGEIIAAQDIGDSFFIDIDFPENIVRAEEFSKRV